MANIPSYPRTHYDANFRKRKASPDGHAIRPVRLDGNPESCWHEIENANINSSANDCRDFRYCHSYTSGRADVSGSVGAPSACQSYEHLSPESATALQIPKYDSPLSGDGGDFPFHSSPMNYGSFVGSSYADDHLSWTSSAYTSNPSTPMSSQVCTSRKPSKSLCPLITGDVDMCQPDRCGPNAACLLFSQMPQIEGSVFVPCTTSQLLLNETLESQNTTETPVKLERSLPLSPSPSLTSNADVLRPSSSDLPTTESASCLNSETTKASTPSQKNNKTDHGPPSNSSKLKARQAHSLVERKYRENLNAKITQLHEMLQSSHFGPSDQQHQQILSHINEAQATNKVRKSDVLIEAMDYIKTAEEKMKHMSDQIAHMHQVLAEVQNPPKFGSRHCENCSLLQGLVGMKLKTINQM